MQEGGYCTLNGSREYESARKVTEPDLMEVKELRPMESGRKTGGNYERLLHKESSGRSSKKDTEAKSAEGA